MMLTFDSASADVTNIASNLLIILKTVPSLSIASNLKIVDITLSVLTNSKIIKDNKEMAS